MVRELYSEVVINRMRNLRGSFPPEEGSSSSSESEELPDVGRKVRGDDNNMLQVTNHAIIDFFRA
jgi:hypothetical protein